MKRFLCLFLAAVCAAVGCFVCMLTRVLPAIKRVEVNETVLVGDSSQWKDIQISQNMNMNMQDIHWSFSFHPDPGEDVVTNTRFHSCDYAIEPSEPQGLVIENYANLSYSASGGSAATFFNDDDPFRDLWLDGTLSEAWQAAEEQGSVSRFFRLADYYDQMPFIWRLDLPWNTYERGYYESLLTQQAEGGLDEYEQEELGRFQGIEEALKRFFFFPVREDDVLTLNLSSYGDQKDASYSLNRQDFGFSSQCAVTEWGCYFTFPQADAEAFSQVPGGLGVYLLPYDVHDVWGMTTNEKGESVEEVVEYEVSDIFFDQLQNVYSVTEGANVLSLNASADGKSVFLLTNEGTTRQERWLTVLDGETAQVVQRLPLAGGLSSFDVEQFLSREDFCVVVWSSVGKAGDEISVICRDGTDWKEAFTIPLPDDETIARLPDEAFRSNDAKEPLLLFRYLQDLDWDGSRLAVVHHMNPYSTHNDPVLLTVLDKTGLVFASLYDSSLSSPSAVDGNLYTYYDMKWNGSVNWDFNRSAINVRWEKPS